MAHVRRREERWVYFERAVDVGIPARLQADDLGGEGDRRG